jgi:hypothetical protein
MSYEKWEQHKRDFPDCGLCRAEVQLETQEDRLFFAEASAELKRARAKFPGEEGRLTDSDWLAVMVEEVGEAAHALTESESDERLREELVQVAAMAARWALSIPRGRERSWKREDV